MQQAVSKGKKRVTDGIRGPEVYWIGEVGLEGAYGKAAGNARTNKQEAEGKETRPSTMMITRTLDSPIMCASFVVQKSPNDKQNLKADRKASIASKPPVGVAARTNLHVAVQKVLLTKEMLPLVYFAPPVLQDLKAHYRSAGRGPRARRGR